MAGRCRRRRHQSKQGEPDKSDPAEDFLPEYRRLAEQRPDAYLPNLASSLNNLSNRLGELGRREEGWPRPRGPEGRRAGQQRVPTRESEQQAPYAPRVSARAPAGRGDALASSNHRSHSAARDHAPADREYVSSAAGRAANWPRMAARVSSALLPASIFARIRFT